jgi:hypothetical protein
MSGLRDDFTLFNKGTFHQRALLFSHDALEHQPHRQLIQKVIAAGQVLDGIL